jgi:hypothetical protein
LNLHFSIFLYCWWYALLYAFNAVEFLSEGT